jgi:ribosomal protein S18 acetylase RimI-like enzyme
MSDHTAAFAAPINAATDDWSLTEASKEDIDQLMGWFPDANAIYIWAGPTFRYPFTRETFHHDVLWSEMASYCLRDPAGRFVAFGQFYDRKGRINLARLVVHHESRGQGAGKRLISYLMAAARPQFQLSEFSLFVFDDNTPAFECYKSMGFVVTEYPGEMPIGETCLYLTRPVFD